MKHLIHGSLGPPNSTTQTAFQSAQQFLWGSQSSVTVGCIYARNTAMQPKNKIAHYDWHVLSMVVLRGDVLDAYELISCGCWCWESCRTTLSLRRCTPTPHVGLRRTVWSHGSGRPLDLALRWFFWLFIYIAVISSSKKHSSKLLYWLLDFHLLYGSLGPPRKQCVH